MNKNNSWLIWVIAVVAVVALILSIVAVNITGNAVFGFGASTNSQTSQGINATSIKSPLTDCVWETEYASINGTSFWLSNICENPKKIVIEGNCGSGNNIWVKVKQNYCFQNACTCAFDTDPLYPIASVTNNILCCYNN